MWARPTSPTALPVPLAPTGYSNSTASRACAACAAGTFGTSTGASAASNCSACAAGSYASANASTACTVCPAAEYATAGASVCTGCPAGSYASASGLTSAGGCVGCAAGIFSGATGQTAALVPAALTWLARNRGNATGVFYLNLSTLPASSMFQGSPSVQVDNPVFQAYPIFTVLKTSLLTITLATQSMAGCSRSPDTGVDTTYAQICSAGGGAMDPGRVAECNNAALYGAFNTSTTPFGLQSSYFVGCTGNNNGIVVTCTTTTYCTYRGNSQAPPACNCGGVGYLGTLNVLDASWFASDIVQACALYKNSSRLNCATGASTCSACAAGTFALDGGSVCGACPANASSAAGGASDAPWATPLVLPTAQFSASTTSVSTPSLALSLARALPSAMLLEAGGETNSPSLLRASPLLLSLPHRTRPILLIEHVPYFSLFPSLSLSVPLLLSLSPSLRASSTTRPLTTCTRSSSTSPTSSRRSE